MNPMKILNKTIKRKIAMVLMAAMLFHPVTGTVYAAEAGEAEVYSEAALPGTAEEAVEGGAAALPLEPDAGAVQPEVPVLEPDAGAVQPEVPVLEPDAGADQPEVPVLEPDAGAA